VSILTDIANPDYWHAVGAGMAQAFLTEGSHTISPGATVAGGGTALFSLSNNVMIRG
jgi:hypothetical protein